MSSAWAWYRGRHGEFPEGQLNNGRWWVQMEQRLLQKRAPLPPLLFPRNWALTALKLQVTSFACSKWGAGCNPLTSYQAGRNVASVRTVGPCSACRTMHEDTRWLGSEDVNVGVRKPGWSLRIRSVVSNTGAQGSVFDGCLSWHCPGFQPRGYLGFKGMVYIW